MAQENIEDLAKFKAPFGQEITLQNIMHESGLQMMRIRLKEGSRFTIIDIDQKTAVKWGKVFESWSEQINNN
jgi:hypothetical protein